MAKIMNTPDWDDKDLEICRQYDEKVKQGKMGYRRLK